MTSKCLCDHLVGNSSRRAGAAAVVQAGARVKAAGRLLGVSQVLSVMG
jgi:hypothetical protein